MDIYKDQMADSEYPWGPRVPVMVDAEVGLMSAGNATRPLDVHGDVSIALSSYLSMVYELRSMTTGVVPLRQEDLLALANAFEMEETDVAERLARLMHCDDLQTKRFIQMVRKGRVLVPVSMVAAGALLATTLAFSTPNTAPTSIDSQTRPNVEVTVTTVPVPVSVDIGDASQVLRVEVQNEPSATAVQSDNSESDSQDGSVVNAPNPQPGEVIVGDSWVISRDNPAE